jgi:hypothetical protein
VEIGRPVNGACIWIGAASLPPTTRATSCAARQAGGAPETPPIVLGWMLSWPGLDGVVLVMTVSACPPIVTDE